MSEICVSVLCAAFNQNQYIRKMLDGLVMQKTSFPVEFLVHDDASTDGTAEIIQEYAEKYPDRIIPFLEEENQYSKGNNFMMSILLPSARGKYLAFCEGDDYWTDPDKLQLQYEAMEAHPECSMCVHRVQGINEENTRNLRTYPEGSGSIGVQDSDEFIHRMIGNREWVYHTTSYFIRTDIIRQAIQEQTAFFMKSMYLDHGLQLLGVYTGKLYYIDRLMSVYRMQAVGGVTNTNVDRHEDVARRRARSLRGIESLTAFDEASDHRYHPDVQKFLNYMQLQLAECDGNYRYLRSREMRSLYRTLPKRVKVRTFISTYIPGFDRFYFAVRKIFKRVK